MSEFTSFPESISHKQLTQLLGVAAHPKAISAHKKTSLFSQKQKDFQELLLNWSILSKELLIELNEKNDYLAEGKSPKSLMALGALQAHLNIALQAQKASDAES